MAFGETLITSPNVLEKWQLERPKAFQTYNRERERERDQYCTNDGHCNNIRDFVFQTCENEHGFRVKVSIGASQNYLQWKRGATKAWGWGPLVELLEGNEGGGGDCIGVLELAEEIPTPSSLSLSSFFSSFFIISLLDAVRTHPIQIPSTKETHIPVRSHFKCFSKFIHFTQTRRNTSNPQKQYINFCQENQSHCLFSFPPQVYHSTVSDV